MTKKVLMIQLLRLLPLMAVLLLPGCALFEGGAGLSDFRTVVLDPGHGGYDNGAKAARGLNEKMLTLVKECGFTLGANSGGEIRIDRQL